MAHALWTHYTVYETTFAGRVFFHTFIDGYETPLTAVEAARLVDGGAATINVTQVR